MGMQSDTDNSHYTHSFLSTAISEMRLQQHEKQRKEEDGNEEWN